MTEIDKNELENLQKNEDSLVIDVREKEEFEDFNIGGMNVPAHLLNDYLEKFKTYQKLIIVCSNGFRSSIIAKVLEKKIPQAEIFHLTDGIF